MRVCVCERENYAYERVITDTMPKREGGIRKMHKLPSSTIGNFAVSISPKEDDARVGRFAKIIMDKWIDKDRDRTKAVSDVIDRIKIMYNHVITKKLCDAMDMTSYCRIYEDSIVEDYDKDIYAMVVVEVIKDLGDTDGSARAYFLGFLASSDRRISCSNKILAGETLQPGGAVYKRAYYAVEVSAFSTDLGILAPRSGVDGICDDSLVPQCEPTYQDAVPHERSGPTPPNNPIAPKEMQPTRCKPSPAPSRRESVLSYAYIFSECDALSDEIDHGALSKAVSKHAELLDAVDRGQTPESILSLILACVQSSPSCGDFSYWSRHAVHFMARAYSVDDESSRRFVRLESELVGLWIDAAELDNMMFRRSSVSEKIEFMERHIPPSSGSSGRGFMNIRDSCVMEVQVRLERAIRKIYKNHISAVMGTLDSNILDMMQTLHITSDQ